MPVLRQSQSRAQAVCMFQRFGRVRIGAGCAIMRARATRTAGSQVNAGGDCTPSHTSPVQCKEHSNVLLQIVHSDMRPGGHRP
eukprot:9802254-Lingulodinium_polyedra.AAC.1